MSRKTRKRDHVSAPTTIYGSRALIRFERVDVIDSRGSINIANSAVVVATHIES